MTARLVQDRNGEFGEASVAFVVSVPVDLERLDAELTRELGWPERVGLVAEGDVSVASEAQPVIVWALGVSEIDEAALRQVVVEHDPTPDPAVAGEAGHFAALLDKAQRDENFTKDEMQMVVRLLLRKAAV